MNAQEIEVLRRELKTLREQVESNNTVGAIGTIDVIESHLAEAAATQAPPPVEEGGGS